LAVSKTGEATIFILSELVTIQQYSCNFVIIFNIYAL
jgi:hypothetical protein